MKNKKQAPAQLVRLQSSSCSMQPPPRKVSEAHSRLTSFLRIHFLWSIPLKVSRALLSFFFSNIPHRVCVCVCVYQWKFSLLIIDLKLINCILSLLNSSFLGEEGKKFFLDPLNGTIEFFSVTRSHTKKFGSQSSFSRGPSPFKLPYLPET